MSDWRSLALASHPRCRASLLAVDRRTAGPPPKQWPRSGGSQRFALSNSNDSSHFSLWRDNHFGHKTPKVLGVVRQVIKVWGVKEISARRDKAAIENHIQGLTTAQRD